jgi:hypothetical protein
VSSKFASLIELSAADLANVEFGADLDVVLEFKASG